MFPSYDSPPYFKEVESSKDPYPRRMPMPGRSYKNPGPGILSAGDMVERESVIMQRSRNAAIGNETPEAPKPEKKEKDWIIKRLLMAEGPVGSVTNPIIIGEEPLMTPPPSPPPVRHLSEEEKQLNTQEILKTLEAVVPLKKRKLPFSAELSALPLPLPPQQIDNSMPVLEPEPMIVEIDEKDVDNRPIPNITESALMKALTSPPLTMQTKTNVIPPPLSMKITNNVTPSLLNMQTKNTVTAPPLTTQTKNGVTFYAFPGGSEQLPVTNARAMEGPGIRAEPKRIETFVERQPQAQVQYQRQAPEHPWAHAQSQASAHIPAFPGAQPQPQLPAHVRAQVQPMPPAHVRVQVQPQPPPAHIRAQVQPLGPPHVRAQVQPLGPAQAHGPTFVRDQAQPQAPVQVWGQDAAQAQAQATPLPKNLNPCGHSVRRLIVVPTLDKGGNWVCSEYVCKQCGWARKCNTQLNHYKELIDGKQETSFTGLSSVSGFQRTSPYDEMPAARGPLGGYIPPNLECNNQQVVTGNSLLHQTGYRREVAYVDPVPSSSSAVRYGMPFLKDGSILKTYICELCLRVEETLWDMTEHRDTDHLGHPVNFLELCSNEKDALRYRCAAVSESDTRKEVRIPTLKSEGRLVRTQVIRHHH